ncbi:MAG: hypothetical protein WCK47_12370 [bacterium]|nr:hypothetical protein [Candidatus Sumerlaeota bacterium]
MKKISAILLTGLILSFWLSPAAAEMQYYKIVTMPDGSRKVINMSQPFWKKVFSYPWRMVVLIVHPNNSLPGFGSSVTQKDMEKTPTPLKAAQNVANETLNTVEKVPAGQYLVNPVRRILWPILNPFSKRPKPTPLPAPASSHH